MYIAARALKGAKVCLIPVPDNDHRPLALRHGSLSFLSLLLIVAKVVAITILAVTPATAELSTITSARIIQLTNAERTKRGLPALTVNGELTSAAAQKAQDILNHDYFAHISPTGVTPWFWIKQAGYSYQVAGENLAIDFTDAEDVVAAWMASPTHKENILLPDYTETGVAVATGEFQGATSTVVVHMFGLPTTATAAPTPTPTPLSSPTVKSSIARLSPTISPTPVITPTISPTPLLTPEPTDTVPPRTPRIAALPLASGATTVDVTITGEGSSLVHLLLNGQEIETVVLPASGSIIHTTSLAAASPGSLTLSAYATDTAQNKSDISEAIALTKDIQPALLDTKQVAFWLNPQIDQATTLAQIQTSDSSQQVAVTLGTQTHDYIIKDFIALPVTATPVAVAVLDATGHKNATATVTLAPQFKIDTTSSTQFTPPVRFSQLTRRISLSLVVALLILLSLAIIIRLEIQHPLLIAHTTFVILLAMIFFLF